MSHLSDVAPLVPVQSVKLTGSRNFTMTRAIAVLRRDVWTQNLPNMKTSRNKCFKLYAHTYIHTFICKVYEAYSPCTRAPNSPLTLTKLRSLTNLSLLEVCTSLRPSVIIQTFWRRNSNIKWLHLKLQHTILPQAGVILLLLLPLLLLLLLLLLPSLPLLQL